MVNDKLIEEIALKCSDIEYKDFDLSIYRHAVYRGSRLIAKRYSLFQKIFNTNLQGITDNIESDAEIDLPDFKEEVLVDVQDTVLTKVANKIENTNEYYLKVIDGKLLFNYSTLTKSLEDDIVIIYNSYPHIESDTEYIIPSKYEEEWMRESIRYLAELGIAKFTGEVLEKYSRILKMNEMFFDKKPDPALIENNNWTTIEPYRWWA